MRMKMVRAACAAAVFLLVLNGCAQKPDSRETETAEETAVQEETPAAGETVAFTDALGRAVEVTEYERVAAMMGSLGQIWQLAGGTLTAVTEDGLEEADGSVLNLGSNHSPDLEQLLASDPDLVLLTPNLEGQAALADTLEQAGITCAYFSVETFEEYLNMLKVCTGITGREEYYQKNGEAVSAEIQEIIDGVPEGEAPAVLFLRAFSTGVKAKGSDSMTGAMLADLGCRNIADSDESLLEDLSLEKIAEADPDFIFVVNMGSSEEKAQKMMEELFTGNPAWKGMKAVEEGHYTVLPKELFHLKPNEKWADSYRILSEILYGENE